MVLNMVFIFADHWDKKGAYFERLVEFPYIDVNPREIHVDPRAGGHNIIATMTIPLPGNVRVETRCTMPACSFKIALFTYYSL